MAPPFAASAAPTMSFFILKYHLLEVKQCMLVNQAVEVECIVHFYSTCPKILSSIVLQCMPTLANTVHSTYFNVRNTHVWAVIECKFEYFVVLSVSSACLLCLKLMLPLEFDVFFISLLLFFPKVS